MLDFVCIGAQKAGTTWLAAKLRENPQVWLHPFKELHYFDHLHYPASRDWTLAHVQRLALERIEEEFITERAASCFDHIAWLARCADRAWVFTDDWHRYCFSRVPGGVRRGESKPAYTCIGKAGIAHVERLMPHVRIIYIIRHPVDRACSLICMNLPRRSAGGVGIEEQQVLEAARCSEILERSDYVRCIAEWEAAFGAPGQILYVPYRRITAAPERVLEQVERHIGVGTGGRPAGRARQCRSVHAAAASRRGEVGAAAVAAARFPSPPVRCRVRGRNLVTAIRCRMESAGGWRAGEGRRCSRMRLHNRR